VGSPREPRVPTDTTSRWTAEPPLVNPLPCHPKNASAANLQTTKLRANKEIAHGNKEAKGNI
jgi:hypothetical protein